MRNSYAFVVKTSLLYCILSAAFSLLSLFLEPRLPLPSPLLGFNVDEIGGHLLWGLAVGAVTCSIRYTIIAGTFAVLIDADHLVSLTHLEAISRMSHSIAFGVIALVVLMALFGKRDYRLGAIAFAAVLSHISFDIFDEDPWFPFFAPIYNSQVYFTHVDWIYFEIVAVAIVGIVTIFASKKVSKKLASSQTRSSNEQIRSAFKPLIQM
ncbi:MAG: metal-dependent hydrolase [Nitrosotalea sp.]